MLGARITSMRRSIGMRQAELAVLFAAILTDS